MHSFLTVLQDVDFIVNIPGAPNTVKTKLLQLPNGVFAQYAQVFVYKHPGGKEIQIDFTPDWQVCSALACGNQVSPVKTGRLIFASLQSPYVPAAAMALATITPNHIPYVEMVDLLALKVSSCGLRPTKDKRLQDARDAVKLADRLSGSGRVPVNAVQRMTIQEGLDAVATPTGKDYAWWNSWLHLQ
jgi:hypothetical protein